MVQQSLDSLGSEIPGARIELAVPAGEEMAKQTLNERLGLLGGISILGTTGIVRPYSTAAYRASVVNAIDLAAAVGHADVILSTGGKTEARGMRLFPSLPEDAFIATDLNNESNILSCILAKRSGARKVIAETNNPSYVNIIASMNMIDCGFSPLVEGAYASG